MLEDILDRKSPSVQESSNEGNECDSDDSLLPDHKNVNFSRAEGKLESLQNSKKYQSILL